MYTLNVLQFVYLDKAEIKKKKQLDKTALESLKLNS